jgi:hypothetical protein
MRICPYLGGIEVTEGGYTFVSPLAGKIETMQAAQGVNTAHSAIGHISTGSR